MAQIYNNIDEHGSDAECSDHKQTRFRCSACVRAPETPKLGARALSDRTVIISEHDYDARIRNKSLHYLVHGSIYSRYFTQACR